MLMEHEYNDLQEEVSEKSTLLSQLRKRYKGALAEIQDLESEHLNEKADLLETIRTLEIDFGFYKAVVDTLMSEGNLYKIKSRSQYDDEKSEWEVPPFVLKGKQINLPKLGLQKAKRFIEEEKLNHDVAFKESSGESDGYAQEPTSKSMLHIRKKNKIANGARNKSQAPLKHANLKQKMNSAPIDQYEVGQALDNSEYDDEEFDNFRNPNGLHDYKER